ncbi:unnamed protein product [Boreogadus saida]
MRLQSVRCHFYTQTCPIIKECNTALLLQGQATADEKQNPSIHDEKQNPSIHGENTWEPLMLFSSPAFSLGIGDLSSTDDAPSPMTTTV